MIRMNEHGNMRAASQQLFLEDARVLSRMQGSLARKAAELSADMAMSTLWLITQGRAKRMYLAERGNG